MSTPAALTPPVPSINDRAVPRWKLDTISCSVLCEGTWHDVGVLDISLTGVKVRGHWDEAHPVKAVSLAGKAATHSASVEDLLILEADLVWRDPAGASSGLRFDIPNHEMRSRLFRFLSGHIADSS